MLTRSVLQNGKRGSLIGSLRSYSSAEVDAEWNRPNLGAKLKVTQAPAASGSGSKKAGGTVFTPLAPMQNMAMEAPANLAELEKAPVESSTLSNGVRVVTRDAASPTARVELRVENGGTRSQSAEQAGVVHFARHLAYERSLLKSPLRVVREMELTAGRFEVRGTRDRLVYSADLSRTHLGFLAESMLDFVLPKLREYILRDLRPKVLKEAQAAEADLSSRVVESLHAVAFGAQGYGHSLHCHPQAVDAITTEHVRAFFTQRVLVPANLTVVGYGVPHAEFVRALEQSLGQGVEASSAPAAALPPATYQGGASQVHIPRADVHVGLAYSAAATGSAHEPALRVLAALLGDASTEFRYPGNGQASRLAQGVLAKHASAGVRSARAIYADYADAGLFGVVGSAQAGSAGVLATALAAELKAALTAAPSSAEWARAVAVAKSAVAADSRCQYVDDLAYAARFPSLASRLDALDKVSPKDLEAAAKHLLSSRPTVVALGDLRTLPSSLL